MEKTVAARFKRNVMAEASLSGIKQKEIAKACGVSERTWRRWMKDPDSIELGYVEIIAECLNLEPVDLFT